MRRYLDPQSFLDDFITCGRGPQLAMKMGLAGEGSQVLSRVILDLAIKTSALKRDNRSDLVKTVERYDEIVCFLRYILEDPIYWSARERFPVNLWL